MKAADTLGTQNNTGTHLYSMVYAEIFKSILQRARHPVSCNQFFTHLIPICQTLPQFPLLLFQPQGLTSWRDIKRKHKLYLLHSDYACVYSQGFSRMENHSLFHQITTIYNKYCSISITASMLEPPKCCKGATDICLRHSSYNFFFQGSNKYFFFSSWDTSKTEISGLSFP